MSAKDEALKMCNEWLYTNKYTAEQIINACKEALEQPAQEPVAWMYQREDGAGVLNFERNFALMDKGYKETALYTHPHQWQGLKDDEIVQIAMGKGYANRYELCISFSRAIEQALKEKNYG